MDTSLAAGRRTRRFAIGAESSEDGTHFRVWAPRASRVDVVIAGDRGDGRAHALVREPDGYFAGRVASARDGDRYWYQLEGDAEQRYPDPASRNAAGGSRRRCQRARRSG